LAERGALVGRGIEGFQAMAVVSEPVNTPLPGTVFTPRQVRMLKIAVIVMGAMLIGGFALVIATIVYQASRLGQGGAANVAVPAGVEAELSIPADATISALALDGDRVALHLKSAAGSEVAVVDLKTGKVLARIKLKADQ
jgi:hypothetical protein